MKEITRYQADDKSIFNTKEECENYEALCLRVQDIMDRLPKNPKEISFYNGKGYLQHDKDSVIKARIGILDMMGQRIDHTNIKKKIEDFESVHSSQISMMLDDFHDLPIKKAWYRIAECMDKRYREWGQPYFANNENEGEQIRLN